MSRNVGRSSRGRSTCSTSGNIKQYFCETIKGCTSRECVEKRCQVHFQSVTSWNWLFALTSVLQSMFYCHVELRLQLFYFLWHDILILLYSFNLRGSQVEIWAPEGHIINLWIRTEWMFRRGGINCAHTTASVFMCCSSSSQHACWANWRLINSRQMWQRLRIITLNELVLCVCTCLFPM